MVTLLVTLFVTTMYIVIMENKITPEYETPTHYLAKRGKTFSMRFRWNGGWKRVNLGVGSKPEARVEAQRWLKAFVDEEAVTDKANAEKTAQEAQKGVLEAANKTLHPVKDWIGFYIQETYRDKGCEKSTAKQAEAYLADLVSLTGVTYTEEFTRTGVLAALAEAKRKMKPKRKFSGATELSGWTTGNISRAWKKFGMWLDDHEVPDLVNPKAFSKLKASRPKAENKKTQLWPITEFKAVLGLAMPLDVELYGVLRWTGINPADLWELRRRHFEEDGKGWKLNKKRAKLGKDKTGAYDQVLSPTALKILRSRIESCDHEDDWIFPEIHDTNKTASSFTSSFGNRNDDYWDMLTFKADRDNLTAVRKGKDYKDRFEKLKTKIVKRKVMVKQGDGSHKMEVRDREWKEYKMLPFTDEYKRKRKVKLVAALRHTFATAECEKGTRIEDLRPAMGHAVDSRTLERFYNQRRSPEEIKRSPLY